MNKVSVEIDAQVEGYVQGIDQACDSAEKYETDTRKVADAQVNLRKELAAAKKQVQNLAAGYMKLDAEAKKSAFGQEMKRQLDAAKEAAAQYIDLQGDLSQELKNMASDTRVFDTMAEGMGVFLNTTTAALGAVAQLTGNEEDAKRAVVAFTTAQSALSAVTKIQNALQMQSNTMMAVSKVQTMAAAAATNIKTAAEGKNVVVTKAATIAQALFNKVAMANPYVILATAIIGVTAALGAFIVMSSKSRAEEEAAARQAEKLKEYYSELNKELGNTIPTYYNLQTQWKDLRTEGEKTQWIKDNQTEFNKLGVQIDNVSDAENFLVNNTANVIEALTLRAKAAAKAAVAQKAYQDQLEREGKLRAVQGKKDLNPNDLAELGLNTKSSNVKHEGRGWISELYSVDIEKEIKESNAKAEAELRKGLEDQLSLEKEAAEKLKNAGIKTAQKAGEAKRKEAKSQSSKTNKELAKNSVEEAEGMVKAWEDQLKKADINDKPLIKKIKDNIKHWQKEVERRKLEVGMDVKVKTSVDMLSDFEKKFEEEVKKAEADYMIAFNTGDTSNLDKLWLKWKKAIDARNDYYNSKNLQDPSKSIEVSGNLKLAPALNGLNVEIQKTEQQVKALEDQINNTNWSALGESGEAVLDALNDDLKDARSKLNELNKIKLSTPEHSIKGISDAISTLESYIQSADWSTMGEEGSASLEKYIERIRELKDELEELQEQYDESIKSSSEKAKEALDQQAESINKVGDAIQTAGELFSALGDLGQEEGFNVMGIVAKAVATVAMSYANALHSASKNWVTWLTFGMSGLATMVSMISAIKQATAGGYAEGGIVGGNSYSGDRLTARVNSGEMILNKRQQQNMFNMLDNGAMPKAGGTNVQVTGVIRGTDLLLVQKNTTKVMGRAGNSINF